MRSRSIVPLFTLTLLWPAVGGLGAQARGQDTRPGIAVFPFENGGSYGQDKDNFDALQKGIAGLMIFDLIRTVATKLMRDANLPALQKQASEQRMNRQVPTEALTYYSRALLYHDRGQKDKAVEMYEKALRVFPDFAEASDGLKREKTS